VHQVGFIYKVSNDVILGHTSTVTWLHIRDGVPPTTPPSELHDSLCCHVSLLLSHDRHARSDVWNKVYTVCFRHDIRGYMNGIWSTNTQTPWSRIHTTNVTVQIH